MTILTEPHPGGRPCLGCGSTRCCDCYTESKCQACLEFESLSRMNDEERQNFNATRSMFPKGCKIPLFVPQSLYDAAEQKGLTDYIEMQVIPTVLQTVEKGIDT